MSRLARLVDPVALAQLRVGEVVRECHVDRVEWVRP
jgi:hypothetical protein